ncbi:MAG: contractile injection system tape measure protein [Gallionella sp.]
MDKRHIIEDAEFDISFDSMEIAREQEPGLADFIRERLLPLADEIFCELADGGTVVRIDRMELDLGDIRHAGFCDEMESRFGEKLRAFLKEKMQSLAATHSPLEGMIDRPQAARGQLEVFLETGRMPWHDHRATGDAVDAMLEQTLARQGDAFVEFMKRTPHRDVVVKRLVRQFPDRLLTDVMRLLAPAHAVLPGELTARLEDMRKKMSASITANELKAQVWERLIGEHLKTGMPDPERLLREIAKDLFVRHARSPLPNPLPQASEGANESLREFHVKDVSAESGASAGNLPGRKSKGDVRGYGEARDEGRVDAPLAASAAKQSEGSSERRSNIARQRALLETAFATGDADELAGQWDALRNGYRELVREVFMQRMGDGKLLKKLAEGFPESMLLDLLDILSPQESGFMAALSGLPELRGAKNEKNAAFWRYTLGYLHGAQDGDRAEYARGLIRSLSAQEVEQRPLLQALVVLAPELQAALADMQAQPATGTQPPAETPARAAEPACAEELYRRVTQRLNGTSGGEPEFAALLEEMASTYPETLARLQRQLQSGELHADVGALDAREAGQMVTVLIRLNSGAKESDFLRAVQTQAQQVRDRQRYYRHILERLIRNETVDLEAALDDADNETAQQNVRAAYVGDAAMDEEIASARNAAHPSDAATAPARTVYLRTLLDTALHDGNAGELIGAWDEIRRHHAGLVRELFERRMGDENARRNVAQGFPANLLAELVRILAPAESRFIETLTTQLQAGSATGGTHLSLWQHMLGYLHATRDFDRQDYAESLMRYLGERGLSRSDTLQAVVRTDTALGQKLSVQSEMQNGGQDRQVDGREEFALAATTGRAAELYRRVTRRLSGASGGEPEFAALVEEMASAYPESLARLQRKLQSGELRADVGRLDAGEARQLVVSLIRLNSGAKESDFLRAIGRYAGRAKSERGYYQRILENMIRNRTIDLVDAARSQEEIVPRDLQRTSPDTAGRGEAAGSSSRQEDHAMVDAEPTLEPVKLLRLRLEAALVLGRAEGVEAVWGELLLNHVVLLREVFAQRLGNEVARSRLVEEFPEPMLHGLIRALAPADGGFVEMLAGQPELRAGGVAGAKNIPLLEYTLSYLHACGASGYDRFEYANGLARRLAEQGFARTDILRAIARIDPELGAAMTASGATVFGGEVVPASATSGEGTADSSSQGLLAGTLSRKLLQRLRDRDRTLAQELGELAGAWPEVAREFYRQLQSDAAVLDVTALSASEASLHAAAFIISNHGRMGDDFLREIELHAGKARDELHYYRTILEMLLRNRVVDLEVAMTAAPGSEAGDDSSAVRARMDDAPGVGVLRSRFESALMEGDAEAIADVWDELRFNRGGLVREVFHLRMGEGASRKKLAERFPEAMLFQLMCVLAPLASGFIESLDKQLGLLAGVAKAGDIRLAAREHALAYIYAFGARDFKRDDYARGLMQRMAVQGMDASLFWRAMAAIDPVLTLSLPESRIGGTPRIGGAARVGEMPSPIGGTTRVAETLPIVEETAQPTPPIETERTAELYERLVLHLSRQDGLDQPTADYSREIAELANAHPETLKRLYRRLQTDELDMDALSLNAGEARQLVLFFSGLAQGNEGKDFQREIDARAGKAKDEPGFYRHILEKLIRNQAVDFDAAMNAQRTPDRIARQRAQLETAFASGDVGELAGQWEALRNEHRELVCEVFMQRMGDGKLLKKLAEGFPESMLQDLLNILSSQERDFMAALSTLPELRGAKNEKNAAFWRYTLGRLHGAQDGDRAEYVRGLIRSLSAQGMEQGPLLQAIVALDPELQAALADMQAEPAIGTQPPAEEPAHAGELYRRVTQRLNGTSSEPEFAALLEEMASAYPEMLARLQRQLQSGELHADVGALDAREAGQMVTVLIRLNSGAKESDFLRAVQTQAQQVRDRQRYYRHILERLIRNETVDLEATLDDAGNEAAQQRAHSDSVGDAALEQPLSAQQDRQADGRERITLPLAEFAETGRASELYRRVTGRLIGASGGEPEFVALVEEMASTYPETLVRLHRQLQSGELRAQIDVLDAGEARQMAAALIRLNSGAKENGFLRAVDAQALQARDRQRYYRYVLERLIRNETVDLEAALDDAAPGNDAIPMTERPAPAGDTTRDEESTQEQNVAHASDEVAMPVRTAWLRTLLDTALSEGNAGELVGAWDEIRQRHAGLVRESFQRRMGDQSARQRVAQGFPKTLLAELVRILAPMESGFIETLAVQLQQEQGGASSAKNTPLWEYTMGYLHATASSGFDRRDYVSGLLNCLGEQSVSRDGILQAVTRTDAALGQALSARQDMRADTQEESARTAATEMSAVEMSATGTSAIETERAGELYRRVTQRLSGASGGEPDFAALVAEMANAYPETLAHLLRQLQAGELRTDVGTLGAREAKAVASALIRLNSGARESEFLRAVERYAARAQSEQGYYRFILENLIHDSAIDLEEAASVVSQEAARQISTDDRGEENRALPGAMSGDKHRPQMVEDARPRVTTGDKTMQVENTSAFDGHGAMDDSESAEEIYIANAGMVLATPYLPQLFRMLDLTEGTKFKDERSAERAIHLLQFMVNESCDSPEFLLSLNKLLCGVPTGVPIVREIELLQQEKDAIEGMLNGIIRNWTILGNTSVQGLRESFLQRSGRLQLKEDNWHLKVEPKGIDVLLDRLPWSFALIKHPWMRRPIYVEWR